MDTLKQKIKHTQLFAPDEKVDILAAMDTYSAEDLKELESIIDEYDAQFKTITHTFETHMTEELDAIVSSAKPQNKARLGEAAQKIKSGLRAVMPS